MTRFWLVRHGPTHARAFTGWRDIPADLSDTAALARLADYLPAQATVTSSDLIRATATADAIARDRPRLPSRKTLREFDFGVWDGMEHTEVSARDPILSRQFWEDPGDLTPPGGESWNMVTRRVSGSLIHLSQQSATDMIVVGHMGMIMTMIALGGGTAYQAMGHKIEPLSVTDITYQNSTWKVGAINHIA